jgi:ABC-2 type transport system ATP-binding protein
MDEAEKLCDRVGIMDSGKIIAMDTPAKLIDNLVKMDLSVRKDKACYLEDVFLSLTEGAADE